jgi:hypothetical protein
VGGKRERLKLVGNEHARCLERCDLRCKCCCSRLVKTGEWFVGNQERGVSDQCCRRSRERSLSSTQAIHITLTCALQKSSGADCGTHLRMDQRCGNSATLQCECHIICESRERMTRRWPRQDHTDLLKERCGWARFARGCRRNKINSANAKRPLQLTRYESAEKSSACCGERALSGSRCAANQQRFAASDVQAVSA